MKKTKIKFEDIKAGDLLEVVVKEFGVRSVMTGVAFKMETMDSGKSRPSIWWATSEDGMLVNTDEDSAIYRIDVAVHTFEDVQAGDKLTVTTKTGNITTIVEDVALVRVNESVSPFWVGKDGHVVLYKHVYDSVQTIDIEREGE